MLIVIFLLVSPFHSKQWPHFLCATSPGTCAMSTAAPYDQLPLPRCAACQLWNTCMCVLGVWCLSQIHHFPYPLTEINTWHLLQFFSCTPQIPHVPAQGLSPPSVAGSVATLTPDSCSKMLYLHECDFPIMRTKLTEGAVEELKITHACIQVPDFQSLALFLLRPERVLHFCQVLSKIL